MNGCRKAEELKSFSELNLDCTVMKYINAIGWSPQDLVLYCRRDGFFREDVFGDTFRDMFIESHKNMGFTEDDITDIEVHYIHELMDAVEAAGFIRDDFSAYYDTPQAYFFSMMSSWLHVEDLPYAFSEARFKTNEEYEKYFLEDRFKGVLEVLESILPPLQFQMFKYMNSSMSIGRSLDDLSQAEKDISKKLYDNLKKNAPDIHKLLLEKFWYCL